MFKPTLQTTLQEVQRRTKKKHTRLSKKQLKELMYEHKLNNTDETFVKEMELEFCKKLLNGISMHNLANTMEANTRSYITVLNYLCLIDRGFFP